MKTVSFMNKKVLLRPLFNAFKQVWLDKKHREREHLKQAELFHNRSLVKRSTKALKTFTFGKPGQALKTMKNRVDLFIKTESANKDKEIENVEYLIRKYEELYKVHL